MENQKELPAPKVSIINTTGGIDNLHDAKKFCQDFARICYSEKNIKEIIAEPYDYFLTDKILLNKGHHSPFDHFVTNYSLEGFSKAFAMVLNNQLLYTTSEKSARYTQMEGQNPEQNKLYNQWMEIFLGRINEEYPDKKFPGLYAKRTDKNTGKVLPSTAEKLSQENARYMTSVFTPTKFGHTLSLRQMNIVANYFEDFILENKGTHDGFKQRLMGPFQIFLDQEAIRDWRIPGMKRKGNGKLQFFGEPNQEFFGKDVYSTNVIGSFAYFAQSQRHRTEYHHISDGWQREAPLGFFVPPIIKGTSLEEKWISDLEGVALYDYPQGQLLSIAQSGQAKNLYEKSRERLCGCAQLEITLRTADLIKKYAEHYKERASWINPECSDGGCKKGGCPLGPANYLTRKI